MMDLNEYFLLEGAAMDRLGELRRTRGWTRPAGASISVLAKVLYIAAALRARPRAIDRYIDYFGDSVRGS